jgi:basic membrane protein A
MCCSNNMLAWLLVVAVILGLAWLQPLMQEKGVCPVESTLKVAMLDYGPIGDSGWTYEGHIGALRMANALPYVELTERESAYGLDGGAIVRSYAEAGYDIIFTHGWGSDIVPAIAVEFPDVVFMCGGANGRLAANVGTYYGRTYEARYLAGVVAGRMTESGAIGYAASYPLSRVIAGINAFARGVASVQTDATVQVEWIGEWYDPPSEKAAVTSLIEAGCDIVTHDSDSYGCAEGAEEGGVLYIASHGDMEAYAPSVYLTGLVWDWSTIFIDVVSAVHDGTWGQRADRGWWYGFEEGTVVLAPLSDLAPQEVQDEAAQLEAAFRQGTLSVFPELTVEQMWTMETFESNVETEIPLD